MRKTISVCLLFAAMAVNANPRGPSAAHRQPFPLVDYCVVLGLASPANERPLAVAVADLNGEGDLDLVTANGASDTVLIRLGRSHGTFRTAQNIAAGRFLWAGLPTAVRAGGLSHTN